MVQVSVEELERDVAAFIRQLEAGESVTILRDGAPIAEVTPNPNPTPTVGRRPIGLCAGEFVVPDDFDDPLPEHILAEFEGA